MVTGRRQSPGASVVGDVSIAEAGLDAALEHLPARGRVAVDRITLAERDRLLAFLPELEIVDAGAIVLAGSTPRSDAELVALREGYRRTEHAVEAPVCQRSEQTTERSCAAALTQAGAQLGLEPHIDHILTVLPREVDARCRGCAANGRANAPWRQLSSDR